MSLLLNMLSRLVTTFLPRSKRLLISWLQSPSAVILEPPKIKSATVPTVSPSICHVPLVSLIFLEEISRLSHSIVSLYFFALITEECFLVSPCYPLELCTQMGISFFFSFAFHFSSLLFRAICKASSDNCFAFFISFSWGWSWSLPLVQCHEPLSIVFLALCLSGLIPWIYLSLPLYNHNGSDFGHTWMVWRRQWHPTPVLLPGKHGWGRMEPKSHQLR